MNYADLQRRIDKAELTLDECKRLGNTHAAYGWAQQCQGNFSDDQRAAYVEGYQKQIMDLSPQHKE